MDSEKCSEFEKELLRTFSQRREIFNKFILEKRLQVFTCPGCGFPTNSTKAEYDICPICDWEDAGYDDDLKSVFHDFMETNGIGGPNRISLMENRLAISRTLFELAENMKGKVIDNPETILKILQQKKRQLQQIYKSIPMTADLNHQGWKDVKRVKLQLLNELISTTN